MIKIIHLIIFLTPLISFGQELSTYKSIDIIVLQIDNDPAIVRKIHDSVSYEKEDGGNNWDSLYTHREYFYRDGQVVKVVAWNKYGEWRSDMESYYFDGKAIKFAKGESFQGKPDYGKLNFIIYYYQDKQIMVSWLTPKPSNIIGVATDVYIKWAYSLLTKAREKI